MIRDLRAVLALVNAPRKRVALSIGLGALTVLLGVGLMASAGYLISRAAERPAILSLMVVIVGVRFFGLARPIARYLERIVSHDTALRALASARARVYERIEPLAPGQLVQYRGGDLLSRLVGDVDSLQGLHVRGIGPPLVALAAGAVSVGVTAAFSPAAALVLAAGLAAAALLAPAAAAAVSRRTAGREAAARGALGADLVELLAGAPELVAYGAETERLRRLHSADEQLAACTRRASLADGLGDGLRLALTGLTVAGVLAVAVSAHAGGSLDRVLIAMLAFLALASFEAVQPLGQAARELAGMVAAGRRILELTETPAAVRDPLSPARIPDAPFTVALEDVSARYGTEDAPALEHVNLRLEPGRRVALVGPSGAGKTTVANLLLRFLDPEGGRVTLAGRDLRAYRQEDVRRSIAVAAQDAHLFSTTVRENVRLGRPGADDREIERALGRAGMLDRVRGWPDGLDTPVGEQGRELSGGERQRISIARALLADAPVLVLDEPTAHLDPTTARALVDDVFAAAGDRSILLITHRPEGLDLVDEVHVLR